MQSNLKIVFLIVLITLITYINILPNKLFFDDEELIYKNSYVQNVLYIPRFFTENMIAGAGKISNMYRPILMTSFAIDHIFWGNNPIGYHLTNIILHAVNGILIYLFIRKLFDHQNIALLTSVFFIVHPVQSEAVSYASGRTDPLYVLFALISINLFISSTKNNKLSLLFFILSLLSKETAVIIPFLLILIRWVLNLKKPLWNFFLIDFVYIFSRLTVLNFSDTLNFYQTDNFYSQNLLVRIYTFTRTFFEYLSIIFYPQELIFARNIQIITDFINPYVIFFLLLNSSLLFYSWYKRKSQKIYLFAFLWFFISILPVSGIIPINSIITEHYLYLPSLSFFLLISYVFVKLWQMTLNKISRSILFLLIFSAFLILSYRTIMRNFDWRDPITFYTKSLAQSPENLPMHNNLAMAYAEQGRSDEAIREYQKTIQLGDVYPNLHHNLANTYKEQGKYQEAEREYKKALDMDPNFIFSYYGLADLYQKTGEKEKLEEIIKKLK